MTNLIYDDNNVFSLILQDKIPCKKILSGEFFLSFYDANPQKKIHALVIPRGKYINYHHFLSYSQPQEVVGFFQGVKQTIDRLKLGEEGYRLVANVGVNGGQEVQHFHMHILGGENIGPMTNG